MSYPHLADPPPGGIAPPLPYQATMTFGFDTHVAQQLSSSSSVQIRPFHFRSGNTQVILRIEAVDSDGHVRSCPSDLGGVAGGRGTRSSVRLAGSRRIRVGSLNVGSLTRKIFELGDALGRHKVDIACFQETKWKGSRAREGNGYKLWYSGSSTAINGVGIILTGRLKENVVRVTRRSDMIMAISVVIEGETVNVISGYAPHVGLRGDLNGHTGAAADGYAGVHGGFGFGYRNEEGCTILEFATAHDLVVANSFFKKSDAHLITFQSGGCDTQIDYLLVRRGDLKACGDYRAFPGEACSSQHRLIIVDYFRATVSKKLAMEDMSASNADQMWNTLARVMKYTAKDSLSVANETARTHSTHIESWWFCEEVQTKVAAKQSRFKELLSYRKGNQEDIDRAKKRYKAAKMEARIAERRRDIGNVRYIKDEGGRTIMRKEDIRKRQGKYFSSHFNETLSEESRPEGSGEVGSSNPPMHYDCYYSRINQGEVRAALQNMGRSKAVGPDQIPIEAWRNTNGMLKSYKGYVRGGKDPRKNNSREHKVFPGRNDIVLIAESAEGLNNKVESLRKALEDNGLRVSREKTEYLRYDFGRFEVVHQEMDIRIGDQILQPKESFRYLSSVLHRSGRIDDDVAHRIRAGWMKWRAASGVLCDRRIPLKLKGKFYRAAIRPAMLYGLECWLITKALSKKVEVAKLRMLRWTCGKTMVDMIPNVVFIAELDVDSIIDKMREGMLRWFGHVKMRPQTASVRRVEALVVKGSRRRGRPKLRWEDKLKMDMKELRLSEDITSDRNA
nr:retrovirus-related Pol polyprotein LINE-1 [Tanacetum cinerariifolium]